MVVWVPGVGVYDEVLLNSYLRVSRLVQKPAALDRWGPIRGCRICVYRL
jgi:hypothetical protein